MQKIALITGATQGIGLATATSLARDHNYHVIIGARNLEAAARVASELQSSGHAASALELDISSEASVAAAVASVKKNFGHLEALVNNAAVLLDYLPIAKEVSRFELHRLTFTTNVIGTAALTEGLIPLLQKCTSEPATLTFLSSTMGSLAISTDKTTAFYQTDYKSYDASKATINMLMLNYHREVGGDSIKVNSVCPGLVMTKLTGFSKFGSSPEVAAEYVVKMATLQSDGPSGTFSSADGPLAW